MNHFRAQSPSPMGFLNGIPSAREWTRQPVERHIANSPAHDVWRREPVTLGDIEATEDSSSLLAADCRLVELRRRAPRSTLESIGEQLENPRVRDQWSGILASWQREAPLHAGVARLPTPDLSLSEDGSVAVEWVLSDRRLGFSLSPDDKESGWYFASLPESGGLSASGHLSVLDMRQLILWVTGTPTISSAGFERAAS